MSSVTCHICGGCDNSRDKKVASREDSGGFHPRHCGALRFFPKKDGGRGPISVEDCVNQARISRYVKSSEEELLKTVRRERDWESRNRCRLKSRKRTEQIFKKGRKTVTWGICKQVEGQRSDETWTWLKEGSLRDKGLQAQDQAILTNYVLVAGLIPSVECAGRVMTPSDMHITTSCRKLAQKKTRGEITKSLKRFIGI